MIGQRSWLTMVLMVAAAFGGGFAAQLVLGGGVARAQDAAAQDAVPGELRVGRVVFVDAQGAERGMLGVDGDAVGLLLKDAQGRDRVLLGNPAMTDPGGLAYWTLSFRDEEGVSRLGMGARDDGEGCGGHVKDAQGVLRVGFGAGPTGIGVNLNDENGQERLGLGIGPGGGGDFVAKDQFGNDIWRALGQVDPAPLP